MKNETGFYLLRTHQEYSRNHEMHKDDAIKLQALKAECKSCLSCGHAKSQLKNSLLRCTHKSKYVNHYNICIQHFPIKFSTDLIESTKESSEESSNV